jgi:hypothetical protein
LGSNLHQEYIILLYDQLQSVLVRNQVVLSLLSLLPIGEFTIGVLFDNDSKFAAGQGRQQSICGEDSVTDTGGSPALHLEMKISP